MENSEQLKGRDVRAIGIFIINIKSNMLLHKKTEPTLVGEYLWEIPYLIYSDTDISPLDAAQDYLMGLGIECQLYEAFTLNAAQQPQMTARKGGHVIIALASAADSTLHFATDVYKWMAVEAVLHDAHEHASHYAPWFRATLEGVALYLKNILKNRASYDGLETQTETT